MSNDELRSWSCLMNKLTSKKAWGKRKEQVFRKGSSLIHHLKNVLSENLYILILCCQWCSTINLFWCRRTNWGYLEVVLLEIPKLNHWGSDKKQGDQTQFFKNFRKRKMHLTLPIIFVITPTDGGINCFTISKRDFVSQFNPLLRDVVKWSETLLKFCSICRKIFKVCVTILRHWEVKG